MGVRVLFVDDDLTLLKSIYRNLCTDYDVAIAESGPKALELLREDAPFKVIVTDMRMPVMDGIEFIREARKVAADSIYIMLTGNQDVTTSIRAVNQGQVFRFLTKPCEICDIRAAVDAGYRQFALVHAERDLLQKTFVGAVSLMTDVVETLHPDTMRQSQRVDTVMRCCEKALGCNGGWEFRLAARLSLVGFALLPCDEQARFQQLSPADPESRQLLEKMGITSARLIGRIPRLERLGEILRKGASVTEVSFCEPGDEASTDLGAVILKVAIYWTNLINNGMQSEDAIRQLKLAVPGIPLCVEDALIDLDAVSPDRQPVELALSDLKEGMILYDNVVSEDGALLLRSGRRLTQSVIEKMRLHLQGHGRFRPIVVTAASCPHAVDALCEAIL